MLDLPEFLTHPDPSIYLGDNYVVVDFETTNIQYGNPVYEANELVLACWYSPTFGRKECVGGEFEQAELVADCEAADFIVAHNAKFELGWLYRCGLDLRTTLTFCTLIAEKVIAGNRDWRLNLNECAERRKFGNKDATVSQLMKTGTCPSDIPTSWLLRYCHQDVALTDRLFRDQRDYLAKYDQLRTTYARCLMTPVLADIERYGMFMDAERVSFVYDFYSHKKRELEKQFTEITAGINPRSRPQMREFLYDTMGFQPPKDYRGNPLTTPGGDLATDKEAISRLRARNKKQAKFIELYAELIKTSDMLSKYLNKMKECCDVNNGNLRAALVQTNTQTHRLSSRGDTYAIQFQNIQSDLKGVFRARHSGWKIGEFDYSQLEFRCAADMAGCEQAVQDIRDDVDIHSYTASILFSEWADSSITEAARSKLRKSAKAHTFKPLYGGSSGTAAQKRYYSAFKQKYKGVARWQEDNINFVLRNKWLRIPSGLVFYWPDTKRTQSGYVVNTANICNYPVQSFATADIVPIGVVWMWHLMQAHQLQAYLVNTIHDSTVVEMPEEEIEICSEIAQEALIDRTLVTLQQLYNYNFTTPLEIEGDICDHWVDHGGWKDNFTHR